MEVSGQLHALTALPPGKCPWYSLDRRLSGPQCQFGYSGKEKMPLPCPQELTKR